MMLKNEPKRRMVTTHWENYRPVQVEADPIPVSPKRAQEIIDTEQAQKYPWQSNARMAGFMEPGEKAWLLWYWEQLPGHYCFYDAITHRASGRELEGVDYVIEDNGNTFRVL